jgi:hypothetical protein
MFTSLNMEVFRLLATILVEKDCSLNPLECRVVNYGIQNYLGEFKGKVGSCLYND